MALKLTCQVPSDINAKHSDSVYAPQRYGLALPNFPDRDFAWPFACQKCFDAMGLTPGVEVKMPEVSKK